MTDTDVKSPEAQAPASEVKPAGESAAAPQSIGVESEFRVEDLDGDDLEANAAMLRANGHRPQAEGSKPGAPDGGSYSDDDDLSDFESSTGRKLARTQVETPAVQPAPAPETAPETATQQETPAAETQQPAKPGAESEEQLIDRFRTTSFDERTRRALDYVARNREDSVSLDDALAYVDSRFPHLAPARPAPAQAAPSATDQSAAPEGGAKPESTPQPGSLDSLNNRRGQLLAEMEQASADLDMTKYHVLNRELLDVTRTIDRETALAESRQQVATEQAQRVTRESMDRAATLYPAINEQGSPLFLAVQAEVRRLEGLNQAFFQTPDWPEIVAASAAAKLGIGPASAKPATPVAAAPPAPARTPAPAAPQGSVAQAPPPGRPGAASARAQTAQLTAAELQAAIDAEEDPDVLREFLRNNGAKLAGVE